VPWAGWVCPGLSSRGEPRGWILSGGGEPSSSVHALAHSTVLYITVLFWCLDYVAHWDSSAGVTRRQVAGAKCLC